MKNENILIVYSRTKTGAEQLMHEVQKTLSDKKIVCIERSKLERDNAKLCVDLAFSIGGDGTVLTCCRALSNCQSTPIFAIDLGTFGYIAEIRAKDWKKVYESYISGGIGLSERKMLSAEIKKKGEGKFEVFSDALNDIVISGRGISKVVKLDMFIDGCYGGAVCSDGVIVASPTGSTAYSLAAGGPILEPGLDALIINPICPFSLSNRPIVVGSDSTIEFKIKSPQRTSLAINADGQILAKLEEGDFVRIRSFKKALFVSPRTRSFIQIIRDKLRWGGGLNA